MLFNLVLDAIIYPTNQWKSYTMLFVKSEDKSDTLSYAY